MRKIISWSLAAVVVLGLAVWVNFKMDAIRHRSKEKAVMSNLRGIAATADQFLGEFGADRIFFTRDELIGSTRFMKVLNPVDAEDYGTVFPVRRDHDETLTVILPDGRETQRTEPLAATMPWGTVVHYFVPPDQDDGGRKQDGVHTLKLPDGRYFKVTYRGGVADGPFRAFYADGKLWGEATYERGRVVGPCWLYTRDGKKSDELKEGEAAERAREGK